MATQPYLLTTFILGSACIGDSRTTINAGFSALDTAVQTLSTSVNTNITTSGYLSATGVASVSALQLNNTTTQTTLLSTLTTTRKFPIYDAGGTLLGYVPICNF
jgi:hypothetical protein